jgi:hypothetical protein
MALHVTLLLPNSAVNIRMCVLSVINYLFFTFNISGGSADVIEKYCDEFAQSITRQQLSKHVPTRSNGSCVLSRRMLQLVARQQSARQ